MDSIDYPELEARLAKLERQYLPPLDPLAHYTDDQVDDMRALRLLVHAEIEFFLEGLCELLVDDLEKQCISQRAAKNLSSSTSLHLKWAESAVKSCRKALNDNNGVKDTNIRKMFKPLGFDDEMFDQVSPVFLDRMKAFGKKRGDTAHQSVLRAVRAITAQGEKRTLTELKEFMRAFCALVHRQRLNSLM